jgi:hypothetical protein
LESTQTPKLPAPSVTVGLPTATTNPTATVTKTVIPPTETSLPICVSFIYGDYAQFEIIGPTGQRVLVDIHNPDNLTNLVDERDILLTTHTHWDHYNEEFLNAFPGMQMFVESDLLEVEDTIIQGIPSAHNVGDRLKMKGGTNTIYLIEMGGVRIVHFGDIGQESITEEQMVILGEIDIAITQIYNPYSDMNAENLKGIKLMEQVQPKVVIPTHLNLDTIKQAMTLWDGYRTETSIVQICETDLKGDQTKLLLVGDAVATMTKYVELKNWDNR